MAKGQMLSNKEKRKPKADKGKKQIAANPSNKSGQTGLKVFDEEKPRVASPRRQSAGGFRLATSLISTRPPSGTRRSMSIAVQAGNGSLM